MTGLPPDVESVVQRLKAAWNSGEVPELAAFRPLSGWTSRLLHELVMVDQECRWRLAVQSSAAPQASPERLLLEDYQRRDPSMQHCGPWPLDVIANEYFVRQRFGDQPGHDAMLQRFPQFGADLLERLRAIDHQLSTLADEQDPAATLPGQIPSKEKTPAQIGRYRVRRVLGGGSFGTVYLADDEQLNRQVAIKVPHAQHLAAPDSADVYLREARTVAGLDHPRIVPVYDIGQTAELPCYIVSKYVQGQTLADRMQTSQVSWQDAARLTAVIADALHYAHKQGVFHRDIKPANILLDAAGDPHVADFGLALREQDAGQGARYAGTPAYCSPEQARGEGHRVNGQSDLFSLGIVLYELLTGRRPFTGSNTREVLLQIATGTPKPPRSINDTFPKELEHICLKALANQASARYTTGLDFAEDLRALLVSPAASAAAAGSRSVAVAPAAPISTAPASAGLPPTAAPDSSAGHSAQTLRASRSTVETPATAAPPARVIPRGLRSFTAEDSDFFLHLLPGPRTRSGLPESIAFWKTRIEQRDAARTFPVGLIYGPSGCGKSSLVKAGLLPCLADEIIAVYVEASALDTEDRLCQALRSRISGLSRNSNIADLLTEIRRNRGHKVLIVLDQFEQWLHANPVSIDQPLVRALRQCDGGHLQTLLMIRDDFYVSISRLMQQLDVLILQQHNCAMVDLFELPHAESVLIRLGAAYGQLPDFPGELSQDQQDFIRAAVQDLAEANKVISVRLALFAQMVRSKPWVPQTLAQVGGAQGVGVAFLEETFSSPRSDVRYRRRLPAVRAMLKALLPGLDTEIKGSSRSSQELQLAAGCQDRHQDFSELLSILDAELRLITPTDTTPDSSSPAPLPSPQSPSYQLTHDYLVPSLREWLLKKQKETPAGRAEIALDERTQMWTSRRESRHLPSLLEYGRIRWYLRSQKKTPAQQQLLKAADRLHLFRGTLTLLLLAAVLLLAVGLRRQAAQQRAEALAGGIAQQKTSDLAAGLVPLQLLRDYALPTLQKLYAESAKDSEARLHLAIARLQLGDQEPELLPAALELSLVCRPEQLLPLTTLLQPWAPQLQQELRQLLQQPNTQSVTRRLHAACLLAAWEPRDGGNADTAWSQPETATFVAQQLAATNPVFVAAYQEVLRPQAARLKLPLAKLFADPQQSEVTRTIVTGLLEDYAKDDVQMLTDVILQADPAADKILFPLLQSHREQALQQLHATLDRRLSPEWPDPPLDPAWTTPGPAVRAQIEAAHGVLADRYAFCLNLPLPELLALVETLRSSGYRPTRLRPVVGSATDSPRMSAVWVRDGGAFAVRPGLKQEELPQPDVNSIHDGLLLADVAYVSGTGPQSGWLTLWDEATAAGEERRCVIGVSDQQLSSAQTRLTKQKFAAQTVLTVHNDARGQRLYSGIFSNTGPSSDTLLAWPGFERLDSPQRDVSGGEPARAALQDPRATYRAQLLQLQTRSEEELQQPQTRFNRARALFQTDQAELAIVELDWLSENLSTPNASVLQFRALTLAQLGRVEDAVAAFNAFQQTKPTASFVDYVSIQLTAWRKDAAAVRTAIDTATTTHQQNPNDLYNIACAAALAGRAFRRQAAADEAAEFSTRALQLLRQAIEGGYADLQNLLNDVDFADLHDHPEFLSLVSRLQPPDRFAGLWFADPALESRLLQAATPELLMQEAKGLLAENWRPVSVVSDSTNQQVSAVLLQRRLIPEPDSVALAEQQAAAATALLRLDAADRVWPLLQDSPDPTVRSLIQQRLPRYGVDAGTLLQQLQNETDVGRRRMLILGLGELAKAELIPESRRESLVQDLVKRCADDPDSGVHGAAEWTLRQLRAESQIAEIRAAFGTGTAVGDRRWYITKTRGDTKDSSGLSMAILDGRREFLMGSPLSEVERYGGAAARPNDELLHRRRIGRVYAIGMHEVTVAQFRAFRANHSFNQQFSKSDDAPANSISWYDAAAFCNWLSEQEGLPREQWCYDPEQEFSSGMQLKANFLELEGYRLPTESEWESAARGDTLTSRFFGSDRGLLSDYAWYIDNSKQQGMLPVGSLRPNQFGLFEPYGNAVEWCQDEAVYFRSDRPFLADGPNSGAGGEVVDASSRVLRGGSFSNVAAGMRSAFRNNYRPDARNYFGGFRVSRTYNLPP